MWYSGRFGRRTNAMSAMIDTTRRSRALAANASVPSCSVLLRPAPSCSVLLRPAPSCSVLLRPAPSCSVLLRPAPSCSVLLRPAPSCSVQQTKHPVTDRSFRSPSRIHHSAAIRAADDRAARGGTPAAFERRSIPAGCVAPRSHIHGYARSSRLASRAPRRSRCYAGFHHGLLAAPVHIHTYRSNTPRREYNDHSRRPEFPAQENTGNGTRSRSRERGGVTL